MAEPLITNEQGPANPLPNERAADWFRRMSFGWLCRIDKFPPIGPTRQIALPITSFRHRPFTRRLNMEQTRLGSCTRMKKFP
jgi:hypothetical protein